TTLSERHAYVLRSLEGGVAEFSSGEDGRGAQGIRKSDCALSRFRGSARCALLAGQARRGREQSRHGSRFLPEARRPLSQLLLCGAWTAAAEELEGERH